MTLPKGQPITTVYHCRIATGIFPISIQSSQPLDPAVFTASIPCFPAKGNRFFPSDRGRASNDTTTTTSSRHGHCAAPCCVTVVTSSKFEDLAAMGNDKSVTPVTTPSVSINGSVKSPHQSVTLTLLPLFHNYSVMADQH
eukprot:scaffold58118_cov37-Cyclotella_meneghiniana.AAC.8